MKKQAKTSRTKSDFKGRAKTSEYQEFVQFMALPTFYRRKEYGFDTCKDFAEKFRVSKDTLSKWKKKEGFRKDIKKITKNWGKDRTPDVILSLYKTCLQYGRAAEVMAWMKIVEDWTETTKVQNEDTPDPTRILAELISK